MRFLLSLATIVATVSRCCVQAAPRAVFAHFMVGNAKDFTFRDWQENIARASASHINGFALNMAADWEHNEYVLKLAIPAAMSLGFKMFFSFDYAGGGPWDKAVVTEMIQGWGKNPAYWQHDGKPLVSTFEGPENAEDWHDIKAATNCFFMPDWSSVGAGPAAALAGGVADGLFSWAAWPWATRDMDTYTDRSYQQALNGKPYMMPVSPWFFTNLPGYNKNWMWWGGNLWYERWQQTLYIQPEYVQIISWNDFGESHYIGPLDDRQYEAFTVGEAPYNYVKGYSHEGWLQHLPFMIDTYLGKNPTFKQESAVVVNQITWAEKCHAGGTTGNTASQLQAEYPPEALSIDRLYIAALLTAPAEIVIIPGDGSPRTFIKPDKWDIVPDGGVGLYYHQIPLKVPGKHTVRLYRSIVGMKSEYVTLDQSLEAFVDGACDPSAPANWNARMVWKSWDPFYKGEYKHKIDLKDRVCIKGWGWGDFDSICQFACRYGYCPDSCVCTNMGAEKQKPEPKYEVGYPKNGDANYGGLCTFTVNLDGLKTWSEECSATVQPQYIPAVSPFLPPACTSGTGSGNNKGLCDYSCNFGFCPINVCTCTSIGVLNKPPPQTESIEWKVFKDLKDEGLCLFACTRGYCPDHCKAALPDKDNGYDQWDFSWVNSYLAMGDSFAAGIGAGQVRPEEDAKACSRYTGAYPLRIQKAIKAPNFVFTACSGDTSADIMQNQFSKAWYIGPGLTQQRTFDLVTMSAGGNDVGFSDVLKACLFLPTNDANCKKALATAENNIDQYLTANIYKLVSAVEQYTNLDGIIVWSLYAKFFDEVAKPCASEQWCFTSPLINTGCAKVTVELRKEMNRLVGKANEAIVYALNRYNNNGARKMKRAYAANWGATVMAMDGQLCEADSHPYYNDISNNKLAFFRPNTVPSFAGGSRLRREIVMPENYNATEVDLWKRDMGNMPDAISMNFHPNELGTAIQANSVLYKAAIGRMLYEQVDYSIDLGVCPLR